MKELLKKIIERLGNEDLVLLGNEKVEGMNVIKPTEFDSKKEYENVLIENLDRFDSKELEKVIKRSKRVFVLLSLEDYLEKMEKLVENFMSEGNLKTFNLSELEKLKKIKNAGVLRIDNSNLLIVFQRAESEKLKDLQPFSQFFLNLSIVEYLRTKLEQLKKDNLSLSMQLENLKRELENKENEINRIKTTLEGEIKRLRMEKRKLVKEFKIREKNEKRRLKKEIIRLWKEKERREKEWERQNRTLTNKIKKLEKRFNKEMKERLKKFRREVSRILEERERLQQEYENKIREIEKERLKEKEKLQTELENAILEFGKKLEEKEEEIKRLKAQIFSS